MTGLPPCRFCVLPDRARIVRQTPNFSVLMSLGPIVEGYALIVTRQHFSCAAEIPSEQRDEFESLVEDVQKAQRDIYGESIIYEHGRSGACLPEGEGEDHCYHAHVHLVPMPAEVQANVARDYELSEVGDWSHLSAWYEQTGNPYLLVKEGPKIAVVEDPIDLPRHYLRSVAARVVGEEHFADWVAFPRHDVIASGAQRLGPRLSPTLHASPSVG